MVTAVKFLKFDLFLVLDFFLQNLPSLVFHVLNLVLVFYLFVFVEFYITRSNYSVFFFNGTFSWGVVEGKSVVFMNFNFSLSQSVSMFR